MTKKQDINGGGKTWGYEYEAVQLMCSLKTRVRLKVTNPPETAPKE